MAGRVGGRSVAGGDYDGGHYTDIHSIIDGRLNGRGARTSAGEDHYNSLHFDRQNAASEDQVATAHQGVQGDRPRGYEGLDAAVLATRDQPSQRPDDYDRLGSAASAQQPTEDIETNDVGDSQSSTVCVFPFCFMFDLLSFKLNLLVVNYQRFVKTSAYSDLACSSFFRPRGLFSSFRISPPHFVS